MLLTGANSQSTRIFPLYPVRKYIMNAETFQRKDSAALGMAVPPTHKELRCPELKRSLNLHSVTRLRSHPIRASVKGDHH